MYRSHQDPLTPYSFDLPIAAVTAPAAGILTCSHVNSLHSIKEEEEVLAKKKYLTAGKNSEKVTPMPYHVISPLLQFFLTISHSASPRA